MDAGQQIVLLMAQQTEAYPESGSELCMVRVVLAFWNFQILLVENAVLIQDGHVEFPRLNKEAPAMAFLGSAMVWR